MCNIQKIDLFYERSHLFKEFFPEYDGDVSDMYAVLEYIKNLYLDIAKRHSVSVHCVCTKLTDALAIAPFDVAHIKEILLSYRIDDDTMQHENVLNKDMVDIIMNYAVGDVFWSESWLEPMWKRRVQIHHHHEYCEIHQMKLRHSKRSSISQKLNSMLLSIR